MEVGRSEGTGRKLLVARERGSPTHTNKRGEADATLESATKLGDLPTGPNMVHCQWGSGARAYYSHST